VRRLDRQAAQYDQYSNDGNCDALQLEVASRSVL